MARVIGSFSLLVLLAVAGCGSSPSPVSPDAAVQSDGGTDAGPQVDAWDICDPVTLEPSAGDLCALPLPSGFLPLRVFYVFPDGDQALELVPDATYCDGAGAAYYVDDESAPTLATVCSGAAACDMLTARAATSGAPDVSATACGI